MDGGHHRLFDAESTFQDGHNRSNTVSGTAGVADNVAGTLELVFVDTEDDSRGAFALGRCGQYNLLGTGVDVRPSLSWIDEESG